MIKSFVFTPLSWLYGALTKIRNKFYEREIFKSADLGAPVISVGNLTVGGTGKTPLVAFIAEILTAEGEKVCILTRGYGRENEKERVLVSDGEKVLASVAKSGDEPFELAEKLLGKALVIADANRAEAGKWAREKFRVTAFLLDDGFQHLKVRRDLDIVCVDATNPFGSEKVLPRGILREPPENLRRADAVVITRANLIADISDLKTRISKIIPAARIFVSRNKISGGQKSKGGKLAAFCALGNPENFFAQMKQEGFDLTLTKTFPDHYAYTQKDVEDLEKKAARSEAKYLVTTAKDAVKLANLKFKLPLIVAESEIIFDDENAFRALILNQIKPRKIV